MFFAKHRKSQKALLHFEFNRRNQVSYFQIFDDLYENRRPNYDHWKEVGIS